MLTVSAPPLPQAAASTSAQALTMRQLEVFHAIMTTGSISAAALMLHVSQPALSRSVALSEQRLQYRLFERIGRRLQPTPEAVRLHAEAHDLYRGLDRLNALAHRLRSSGVATLQIAASATFVNALVPAALQRLRAQALQLRVDFRTATYEDLPEYLLSGRVDVGISITGTNHPRLKSQLLGTQRLLCVIPQGHPLAPLPCIDPLQLQGTPWIGYPSDTPLGQLCAQTLQLGADSAQILVRSAAIALNFVQAGLGAAIVDAACLPHTPLQDCVVRPLTHDSHSEIWATTSAHHAGSVAAQSFIQAMRDVVQSAPCAHHMPAQPVH